MRLALFPGWMIAVLKRTKIPISIRDVRLFGLSDMDKVTQSDIKTARDLLMQTHHPDKGGATEKAQEINRAYTRLSAWVQHRDVRERRAAKLLKIAMGVVVMVASGGVIVLRHVINTDRDPLK